MLDVKMEKVLAKYTSGEQRKVWKVTTESADCLNCIFMQRLPHVEKPEVVGYKCNKRNLTSNGYKLDELFVAANFSDWRCDTFTRFSYKPTKKDIGMTQLQKERKARNEEIFAKYATGMSINEISEEMSLNYRTVYSILKRKK